MGQWKRWGAPGDGGPIAGLFYDGDNERVVYYVIDGDGGFVGAATPNGSLDRSTDTPRLVEGGIRSSGEVIVGIDGLFYSGGQSPGRVNAGDGTTPFSIGDVSNGGHAFAGTIDHPFVTADAAPDGVLLSAPLDRAPPVNLHVADAATGQLTRTEGALTRQMSAPSMAAWR